jgi:hypothetical protein
VFDSVEGKWLAETMTLDEDLRDLNFMAAEGSSLKEALMNLADKINV